MIGEVFDLDCVLKRTVPLKLSGLHKRANSIGIVATTIFIDLLGQQVFNGMQVPINPCIPYSCQNFVSFRRMIDSTGVTVIVIWLAIIVVTMQLSVATHHDVDEYNSLH